MKIKSICSALLFLAHSVLVSSTEVTFKVIAVNGNPSVIVNGQEVALELHEYPVYKGTVDVNLPAEYHYVITNTNGTREEEVISRIFEENPENSSQRTLNEFFNRSITTLEHPTLPRAYEKYAKSNPSNLYDDNSVATIIIKADQAALDRLYANTVSVEKITGVEVTYATPFSVRTFKDAILGISGQSTVFAAKLSYKLSNLKTEKNKELYKRTAIKLRAEHMDPSFLRDKIYGDILNSLGVPTAQNKFARVFINGKGVGLFVVSDDIDNKRYLRETLNNGEKYELENAIFKADYYESGGVWGDLGYYGEDPYNLKYGIYYYKGDNEENLENIDQIKVQEHLIPFLKDISNYPTTGKLNMDIEMFLKFMAMEYAGGAIDNFWMKPGNYYLFKDVAKNHWLFLDSDFHYSMGVGQPANELLLTNIDNYVSVNKMINETRPMIDNILSIPQNKEYLKGVLRRLIETSFNINVVFPRIDSFVTLIDEDVKWDFTLSRSSLMETAEDIKYKYDDFIYHTTVTEDENILDPNKFILPLKYWILKRGQIIANELQMVYPNEVDISMGTVETPLQTDSDSGSEIIIYSLKSLLGCLAMILITFVLF